MTLDSLLAAARFLHFGASMLAFGAALFPYYAGVRPSFPMRAVAAAALASGAVWLSCVLIEVTGDPAAVFSLRDIQLVLFTTGFGATWLVHLALGAGLVVASLVKQEKAAAAVSALNLASLTGIGHAAVGTGLDHAAHLVGHATHLLAGGAWLGGLVPLRRALRVGDAAQCRQVVGRFSTIGYGAVGLVILTGVLNTRAVTGAFVPAASTSYGRLLFVKLGLVAFLLSVALFNQFYATRRGHWSTLGRGIGVELAVFAVVLIVVSLLGATSPMS